MKKTIIILAAAVTIGLFNISTVNAIQPAQFNGIIQSLNTELAFEEEIKLEKWMYTPERISSPAIEEKLELSSWMMETGNWSELSAESEIELEDWMINKFDLEHNHIALEDWMTRISG